MSVGELRSYSVRFRRTVFKSILQALVSNDFIHLHDLLGSGIEYLAFSDTDQKQQENLCARHACEKKITAIGNHRVR